MPPDADVPTLPSSDATPTEVHARLAGRLDAPQAAAAFHGLDSAAPPSTPPLLIHAGAGTGKTTTLAARAAALVLAGADPNRLLLLTFSRRAAHEMRERTRRMLREALGWTPSREPPQLPWAGTFHAVGARLLALHARAIGLPPAFDVLDRPDAEALIGLQREALGLASTTQRAPTAATCLAIHARAVVTGEPTDRVVARHFPWFAGWAPDLDRLFDAYADAKRRQRALDLDDLLLVWADAMAEPTIARDIAGRFDHVLVDELQDVDALQAGLLRALRPDGRGLTAVGDDAQAIYGFRAGDVRHLRDFPHAFPLPAAVVPLTRNHRSVQPVLDLANAILADSPDAWPKRLWTDAAGGDRPWLVAVDDESAQARWVADRVLALREEGLALRRQAVLFRTGTHAAALELELTRRGIPFVKHGGLRFLDAAHVRDLLALLRLAHNPRARLAAFRVLQVLPGVGPATAHRLVDAMEGADDPLAVLRAGSPAAAAAADWPGFIALLDRLVPGRWPDDVAEAAAWLAPHLARRHADAAARQADLDQLARLAPAHGDRGRFLAELAIDPPAATSDESAAPSRDEDCLTLSTIHAAKGREWAAVTVLSLVDGCLPADLATGSPQEIEEERRLLYVAVTRAQRHLALVQPLRFHVENQARFGDRHVYGGPSRFLTPGVVGTLDVRRPGDGGTPASARSDDASPTAIEPAATPAPTTAPQPGDPPPRDPWSAAARRRRVR
jgi:DNA helicase-2/ATP-dependent DNA helicase PcrA